MCASLTLLLRIAQQLRHRRSYCACAHSAPTDACCKPRTVMGAMAAGCSGFPDEITSLANLVYLTIAKVVSRPYFRVRHKYFCILYLQPWLCAWAHGVVVTRRLVCSHLASGGLEKHGGGGGGGQTWVEGGGGQGHRVAMKPLFYCA
jgi:hypothetical protein